MKLPGPACSFVLACLVLAGCSTPPDQERIRAAIDTMVGAAEEKQTGEFMSHIAMDFSGSADAPDRRSVERLLLYHQIRNKHIGVALRAVRIEVQGDRATASFSVLVTGSEGWLPERGRDYAFVTGWRLDDGEWKLINARWD